MKRLFVLLTLLVALALVLPTGAAAADPIPLTPWDAPDPIPAGAPLVVPAGWVSMTRGLTMQSSKYLQFYFTIWDVSGAVVKQCTVADSHMYWLPGVRALGPDEMWPPFNEHIGAGQFAKDWRCFMPEGLSAGRYHMIGGVVQTRNLFDLYWYFDGQYSPMKLEAGDTVMADWEFTVE